MNGQYIQKTKGQYVQVFLPEALYDHCILVAERKHLGIATMIREMLIDASPVPIQEEVRPLLKGVARMSKAPSSQGGGRNTTDANMEHHRYLVEKHRDQVMMLIGKKWTENAICALLRVPYKVVQEIVTAARPAPSKPRGGQ